MESNETLLASLIDVLANAVANSLAENEVFIGRVAEKVRSPLNSVLSDDEIQRAVANLMESDMFTKKVTDILDDYDSTGLSSMEEREVERLIDSKIEDLDSGLTYEQKSEVESLIEDAVDGNSKETLASDIAGAITSSKNVRSALKDFIEGATLNVNV